MRSRWCSGLLRREELGGHGVDHRQQRVGEPGAPVARVEEQLDHPSVVQPPVPREDPVDEQLRPQGVDPLAGDPARPPGQAGQAVGRAVGGSSASRAAASAVEGLRLEDRRSTSSTGAAARCRVGRLQAVVPVAVPVRGQPGPGDAGGVDGVERAVEVVEQGRRCGRLAVPDERLLVPQEGGVAGGPEVVAERQQRPVDDVPVGVPLLPLPVAGVELERLRPVALGVLGAQEPRRARRAARRARPRRASRPTGPWLTSRVPQPPPVYCSSPRGDR